MNGHRIDLALAADFRTRYEGRARYIALNLTEHGTRNGYQNHGCRCRDCTAAATADRMNRKHQ